MFEKELLIDGERFMKEKQITAKRPSEYWLLFFKNYVLVKQRKKFDPVYLIFLIPIAILLALLSTSISSGTSNDLFNTLFPAFIISIFVSVVAVIVINMLSNKAFVDIDSFDQLAKFIIDIKGDILRNLIGIQLNFNMIENQNNLLDPNKIGLTPIRGVKYKPYELERYRAIFSLKDNSFCSASLYQISLKVTTTKRRSSGKVKTKSKHKHKFFYMLSLKLKESSYKVVDANMLELFRETYGLTIRTENGFHIVKIKSKQKIPYIKSELTVSGKKQGSIFTEMMSFLIDNEVIVPNASNKITQ